MRIRDLLETQAGRDQGAMALLAPGRRPLSYGRLLEEVDSTVAALNALGIGRRDRVAVVLENGPEMAVAFLGVASGAACAPLNPAYRVEEFDFYLSDLAPRALLAASGAESPALEAAQARSLPVIRLRSEPAGEAGVFTLEGAPVGPPTPLGFAEPEDVALLLHTSGTTARPKLVPLTQANLCRSARNIQAALRLVPEDRCLNVMPLFHVHGLVGALLASLAAGAGVVCAPGFLAPRFFEWLGEFQPTWYTAVPTMHQAVLARAASHPEAIARSRLRLIRSCSAALPLQVMEELERRFGVPVIEAYGMTEASHQMASNPLPPAARKPRAVGVAAGPEIGILDQAGRLLGPLETGEVVIRGPNVMRGYENNPAANAASFTNGWFRTGDQGWLDEEGYLFLAGRTKEIINRAGEKVSPREIDEVLLDHPAVAQAVTFALPDARLGEDIGVAVVLRPGAAATESELRQFAAQRLADFKVPRRVIFLAEIPQGPTGKPQRLGLAAKLGLTGSASAAPPEAAAYAPPRNPFEETLCEIWREVLGVERAGIHDDFFQSGGDSILGTQLIARIRETFHAELPVLRLFETPTMAGLAEWLGSQERGAALLPPLAAMPPAAESPLSFAQERMWFLAQYEEDRAAYNRPAVLRLRGALSVEALERSLDTILERHAALRTTYQSRDGAPVQVVWPHRPQALELADLSSLVETERAAESARLLQEEARRPFDLSRDRMLRVKLLRLGAEEHLLVVVMHHLASDGWSTRVFLRELAEAYGGRPLAPLPIRYADFARWQRQWLQGEELERRLAWWRERLAGSPPVLGLPTDRPRPALQTYRGARESRVLDPALAAALRALGRQEGATLFMTLLAAFQTLLHRYTGSEDIVVGSPVAGRTHVETEGLIGLFVNTLALRTDLAGEPSFRELLRRVRQAALEAYAHQELPFEKLVEALHPQRSLTHAPLFQVMFQLRNVPRHALDFGALRVEEVDFDPGVALFDLTLETAERPEGLDCLLTYNTDLFQAATARRMLRHFQTLLEAAARHPDERISRLPLMTEPERRQILVEWNGTKRPYPQACLHELFEAQAARRPDAVAVVFGDQQLTYGELNRQANQLAHYLRGLGVGPEVPVALMVQRSPEMVAGVLSILKAGGAYLPLDPDYPPQRLEFMAQDAGIRVLLTETPLRERCPKQAAEVICLDTFWESHSGLPTENPASGATPDNLVYVIYTSGSTGPPKGVEVTHRALVRVLYGVAEARWGPEDRHLQLAPLAFDASAHEIWGTLLHGGRCVLFPGRVPTARELERMLKRHDVTTVYLMPALFNALIDEAPEVLAGVLQVHVGGEAVSAPHVRRALRLLPHTEILQCYGPTENGVWTTFYAVPRALDESLTSVPIGGPVANTQVYVLDRHLEPVPVGVPGELCTGGDGLARGYRNRPDLTAEKFVPHPFSDTPGARLYRTGDLARWLPDGNLEFLGRLDGQVKIRGYRIELGEIEAALKDHPAVGQAAVVAREDRPGEKRLVAYVVARQRGALSAADLRDHLRAKLPEFMVPSAFVMLEALPLNPNGKVDRGALPAPGPEKGVRASEGPRTPVEEILCGIWAELLGREPVGIHDDFFALGGHSLLALRVIARVHAAFQVDLPVRRFFETPTVAALALAVVQLQAEQVGAAEVARLLAGLEAEAW